MLGTASTAIMQTPAAQARTEPLGIIDELLAECARTDNCASSQDDRPPVFAEPWAYESSAGKAMQRLRDYVAAMPGAEVITADERYLRWVGMLSRGHGSDPMFALYSIYS